MKKIFLPLAATAAFILVVGLFTQNITKLDGIAFLNLTNSPQKTTQEVVIKGVSIKVSVADTDTERRQGLSGRESMPEDEGVLFTFPKENVITPFWMKDMKMAIDIIWINDAEIVQIDRNASPQPGVPDNELTLYKPTTPVDYVLEVNAGWADRHGVLVGEKVEIII